MRSRFHFLAPRGLGASYRRGSYPLPDPGRTIRPMFDSDFIPPSLRPAPKKGVSGLGSYTAQDLASMVASGADLDSAQQAQWNALPLAARQQLLAPYAPYQSSISSGTQAIQLVSVLDPTVIAAKVARGLPLTAQETAVWNAQTPVARGAFMPTASSASWLDQSTTIFGYTIPNTYLAGGGAFAFLLVALGAKKRSRF